MLRANSINSNVSAASLSVVKVYSLLTSVLSKPCNNFYAIIHSSYSLLAAKGKVSSSYSLAQGNQI